MATCQTNRGRQPHISALRAVALVRDRLDNALARRCRRGFGERLWLVSWTAIDDRTWLARVSAPEHPETVEAPGRTRVEAIRAAAKILARCLAPF